MNNLQDIVRQRRIKKFASQYDETVGLECTLREIIIYLRTAMDGKALDWQERDRIERVVRNLTTTQEVLAASLSRHAGTMRNIKELQSA